MPTISGVLPSSPRYRIQMVVEMTGVSAPTLRAWERRYHIPKPQRTAAAYRLYSDEDVEQVRRMRELCHAGHSAAEAASIAQQTIVDLTPGQLHDPLEFMRRRLIVAAEAYDANAVQDCLDRVLSMGSAVTIYEQVLSPVLQEVGARWSRGNFPIGQEHLLTTLIETTLRNLLQLVQPVDATQTVLLGCYANDPHTLGLYGAGLRFATWGYRVIMMGSSLPPDHLREAVVALQPQIVGLSRVLDAPAGRETQELTAAYAVACPSIPWVVGGAGAARLEGMVRERHGLLATGSPESLRQQIASAIGSRT